jgi:hypothetical protein
VAHVAADAQCRTGPLSIDELGQENLFDEEQSTEQRRSRRQPEFAWACPVVSQYR